MDKSLRITTHQQIFSLITGFTILVLIIELIRRRKLKEEFSWVWLLAGGIIFLLVAFYDFLLLVTKIIGAKLATSALFIFGLIFLIILNLFHAIKLSDFADEIKNLSQKIAILEGKFLNNSKNEKRTKEKIKKTRA